jgi:hypothetical protein
MSDDVLKGFSCVLQELPKLFEDEISFGLCDREKFLKFVPSEHMPAFAKAGDSIPKDDVLIKAMNTGKIQRVTTDRCSFGFQIRVVAVPIKDGKGNIVGGISYGRSLKNSNDILDVSKNLIDSFKNIKEKADIISSSITGVSSSNEDIVKQIKSTSTEVNNTDGIINFVKQITKDTRLLGLNASIEAARVGEEGRGFGVVASEIKKLSTSSAESINEINNVIKKIKESVADIEVKINESSKASKEQSEAIMNIINLINDLYGSVNLLSELSDKI